MVNRTKDWLCLWKRSISDACRAAVLAPVSALALMAGMRSVGKAHHSCHPNSSLGG